MSSFCEYNYRLIITLSKDKYLNKTNMAQKIDF